MINYASDFDRKNLPSNIIFECYKQFRVIPEFAKHSDGTPYTGKASGSGGVCDWSGYFKNGVPHGIFLELMGGRNGQYIEFNNGTKVDKA